MENKLDLDEVDLNRLYEALVTQIETYNCARAGGRRPMFNEELEALNEELEALKELRDRIGKMLDGEEEPVGNFFSSRHGDW
jgi:hypothetical protein